MGGLEEDERASPCQMKHRRQLSPAAAPTHLTCSQPPPPYMHQVLPMRSASFAESDKKCRKSNIGGKLARTVPEIIQEVCALLSSFGWKLSGQ